MGEVAERTDTQRGIREVARFFGPGENRLFGVTYTPLGSAHAGVLICGSLLATRVKSYRTEVGLARALAARGVVVQRFDYRGFGHSQGDRLDATFESMTEDALAARALLGETYDGPSLGFAGIRWGALTAAAAAASTPAAPLALLGPIDAPADYFREALMAQAMRGLLGSAEGAGQGMGESIRAVMTDLRAGRSADILGFTVGGKLYLSSNGRSLQTELGASARPVLLVLMGRRKELERARQKVAKSWERRDLTVQTVRTGQAWWFLEGGSFPTEALIKVGATWLTQHLVAENLVAEKLGAEHMGET